MLFEMHWGVKWNIWGLFGHQCEMHCNASRRMELIIVLRSVRANKSFRMTWYITKTKQARQHYADCISLDLFE